MVGGIIESVLLIGVALVLIVVGIVQLRRWDKRSWEESNE